MIHWRTLLPRVCRPETVVESKDSYVPVGLLTTRETHNQSAHVRPIMKFPRLDDVSIDRYVQFALETLLRIYSRSEKIVLCICLFQPLWP